MPSPRRYEYGATSLPFPHRKSLRENPLKKNAAGRHQNTPHLCCGCRPKGCGEMSQHMPAEHRIKRTVRKRQCGDIPADCGTAVRAYKRDRRRRDINPDRIPAPRRHGGKRLAVPAAALKDTAARRQRRQFRRCPAPAVSAQRIIGVPAGHSRTATPRAARYSFTPRTVISP